MLLTTGQGMGALFKTPANTTIAELDITGFTYNSTTMDITTDYTRGFCFNNNGTKMYLVNNSNTALDEYTFGTIGDITTLSATGATLDLGAGGFIQPQDVCLSSDETDLYICDFNADIVRQYTMSTPGDLSTVLYSGNEYDTTIDLGSTAQAKGIALVNNDTTLFLANDFDDRLYRFDLSVAKDLSTLTFTQSASIARGFTIYMNETGTKLLVGDVGNKILYQYSMSTPYDLSTLAVDTTIDMSGDAGSGAQWGICPTPDNQKLILSDLYANFYEYG